MPQKKEEYVENIPRLMLAGMLASIDSGDAKLINVSIKAGADGHKFVYSIEVFRKEHIRKGAER